MSGCTVCGGSETSLRHDKPERGGYQHRFTIADPVTALLESDPYWHGAGIGTGSGWFCLWCGEHRPTHSVNCLWTRAVAAHRGTYAHPNLGNHETSTLG